MNKHIVVIDGGYRSYEFEEQFFNEHGYDFDVFTGGRHDREAKIAFAKDAVGVLLRWTIVDRNFLESLPQLKAIVRYGTGYDNIDIPEANRHGVRVANVQSYANHAVSDHALALLLGCARLIPSGQSSLRSEFGAPPAPDIRECREMTLGIIGLGRIGGAFCQKAQGLFHRILAVDPYILPERFDMLNAEACDLSTLLHECHAISLHCNLTEETEHLLDANAFHSMTQRPIIINTSRGPVLDNLALFDALQHDIVHSAGLDVYPDEPPSAELDELLAHPRVIATGHYAWYSTYSALELQRRAARNLVGLLQDEPVEDELTER